ncbi:hypothetical protein CYMTET_37994 [Cymbomonas tetramitiformis]|uniref:G domain-containing protein n=1 Tax=Cymbomonas tetramitiformis TaxID=36881 RepID=A0AAE0F5N1_9CHLO|nr:hypothetical protein CYMTET_37994 [Cymbomonas tetramitiformis]
MLHFHNFKHVFGTRTDDLKNKEEHKECGKGFQKETPPEYQEAITVAIIGAPNAGKSVLTNTLIGKKVTAVSNKTNTTTREMLGALTRGNKQMLLYDTPGVVGSEHTRHSSQGERVRMAWGTALSCDLILFIVDAFREVRRPDPRIPRLLRDINASMQETTTVWSERDTIPTALLLNKVDRISNSAWRDLEALREKLSAMHDFDRVFYTSGKFSTGTSELQEYIFSRTVEREWELPPGHSTDLTPEALAVELVRESIFRRTSPHLVLAVQKLLVAEVSLRTVSSVQKLLVAEVSLRTVSSVQKLLVAEVSLRTVSSVQKLLVAEVSP